MNAMVGLRQLEKFFFEAMPQGWASGNEGEPMPEKPGWNQIAYHSAEHRGLVLVDRWGKDLSSGLSSGQTIIIADGVPHWAMHYGKQSYPKEVLPFLRIALLVAYDGQNFRGGRGPDFFTRHEEGVGNLYYCNTFEGTFSRFSGRDRIFDWSCSERGGHWYWGGSLLPWA